MSEKKNSPRKYSRGANSGFGKEFTEAWIRGLDFWVPEEYRKPENPEDQAEKEPKPSDNK